MDVTVEHVEDGRLEQLRVPWLPFSLADELILPPPPTIELVEALVRAPRLARIAKIRVPLSFIPLDRARFAAALPQLEIELLYPHRSVADVHGREAMAISVGDEAPVNIGLAEVLHPLETRYLSYSKSAREAIDDLIFEYEDLEYANEDGPRETELPYTPLADALTELLAGGVALSRHVVELLAFLEQHRGRHGQLRIRKFWGW